MEQAQQKLHQGRTKISGTAETTRKARNTETTWRATKQTTLQTTTKTTKTATLESTPTQKWNFDRTFIDPLCIEEEQKFFHGQSFKNTDFYA